MKGIVFAAGIGSRLKPFTDHHPKALAEIGGIPLLERVIKKLKSSGVDGIVVNVHHFSGQVVDFLKRNDNFGVDIEISDESQCLLDTGGGLAKMARESKLLRISQGEPIIVHNSDILTDFPLDQMVSSFNAEDYLSLILVDPDRFSTRSFLFGEGMRLVGWHNSQTLQTKPVQLDTKGLMPAPFGGVHVISRGTLDALDKECGSIITPFSITDFYLRQAADKFIKGYIPKNNYSWYDIGTPEKLETAERGWAIKENKG